MQKEDILKHKKWLRNRRRANRIKRQHNYETKTLRKWQFAPENVKKGDVKEDGKKAD